MEKKLDLIVARIRQICQLCKEIEQLVPSNVNPTDELAESLYQAKIFPQVNTFVNKCRKFHKNEQAIYHALNRIKVKADTDKKFRGNDVCWRYGMAIMGIENPNYNEADYQKKVEQQKRELEEIDLTKITKPIG